MSDDLQLWERFLQSDKKALSAIFLNHHDDLVRYGRKLAGDRDMVNDCIQDLFLKLWKNRTNLKPIEHIKPYLFRSLRNHIIDSLEFQRNDITIDVDFEYPFSMVYSHEDFSITDQVADKVRINVIEALNKLKPRQREAIYLRYFEELNFDVIAHVMEMNVQSVRNVIHRGMISLRDIMLVQPFLLMLGKIYDFRF